MSYLQHSKLRNEELIDPTLDLCPNCENDSIWKFQLDSREWIDECIKCRYTKWWCDKEEEQSQQDYKNSLKNDY